MGLRVRRLISLMTGVVLWAVGIGRVAPTVSAEPGSEDRVTFGVMIASGAPTGKHVLRYDAIVNQAMLVGQVSKPQKSSAEILAEVVGNPLLEPSAYFASHAQPLRGPDLNHVIREGSYVVLSLQEYYDDEGVFDDERLETLLVELRNVPLEGTYHLPSPEVHGLYKQESVVWPSAEYSEALEGTISVRASTPEEPGKWQVAVDLQVTFEPKNGQDARPTTTRLQGTYPCRSVSIDQFNENRLLAKFYFR